MELALRPMSTSQVLDRTFSLYRQNFLLFAGIAAVPPALVLVGELLLLLAGQGFSGGSVAMIAAGVAAALVVVALVILWVLGYALASGASVYAVSRVHLGHSTSIAEAYRLIKPYTGTVLGIVVIVSLCLGAVLLVAVLCIAVPAIVAGVSAGKSQPYGPGLVSGLIALAVIPLSLVAVLYLSAKLSLAIPACVIEKLGMGDSIKRSWNLSRDSALRLALVNILAAILSFAVAAALSIPYFIGVALMITKKETSMMMPFVIWQYVADFLARSIAFPIATIAVSLIYYDERVRKEAFDLHLMMEAIGRPASPQVEVASGVAPITE